MNYRMKEGNYEKYGVQMGSDGATFTFEAEKEAVCSLILYEKNGKIAEKIALPDAYCRGAVRSVKIMGLSEKKLCYNYEIDGEIITDPYAVRILGREKWNDAGRAAQNYHVCGGYVSAEFDWEEDRYPETPRREMVMYKLHIRGFSMDAGLRGKTRGTFAAVEERIPYFKELGITTLEFMPVYEFEEVVVEKTPKLPDYLNWEPKEGDQILPEQKPEESSKKVNFWGYGPGNYFAVKASYGSGSDAAGEWKTLIKKLHAAGIECVMEMYFPVGENQNLMLDALRYWVREYHVDGFHLLGENLPVTMIAQDALLRRTKIFYVGFDEVLLKEKCRYPHLFLYNNEYLYPVRGMLNHINGSLEQFVCQQRKQHTVQGFVNYIADNNGFTLYDLFCYAEKHNEANGEGNCDGNNWNLSNNYGYEGKTTRKKISAIRERQLCNAIAVLMLAQGVPLLFSGDETGNSQEGNNNAYCQDNPIGWVNWKKNEKFRWLTDFVREMIAFRKAHPVIASETPKELNDYLRKGCPDLSYHSENAWVNTFLEGQQAAGVMYCGKYEERTDGTRDDDIYIGYNFHMGPGRLALPKLPEQKHWYLVMDTAQGKKPFLVEQELQKTAQITLRGQSVVILVGK